MVSLSISPKEPFDKMLYNKIQIGIRNAKADSKSHESLGYNDRLQAKFTKKKTIQLQEILLLLLLLWSLSTTDDDDFLFNVESEYCCG